MNALRFPLALDLARPRIWLPPLSAAVLLAILLVPGTNRAWFLAINGLAAHLPDAVWSATTVLGDTLMALCLSLALLRARPDLVIAVLLAAVPATLLSHGLKDLVDAARPFAQLGAAVHVIGPTLKAGSFPSGHTTTAFTLAAVLATGLGTAWLARTAIFAALAVGLSRVAVGAHWPADIAAGMLCGWAAGLLGLWLSSRLAWQRFPSVLAGVRLFLIGCALVLLIHFDSGYPLARPFEQAVAFLILVAHLMPGWRLGSRQA